MVRLIAIMVGIGFTVVVIFSLLSGVVPAFSTLAKYGHFVEPTVEHEFHAEAHAPASGFGFAGPFGKFDNQQLQRGFQVYKEVCSSCHGLKYVSFRNMAELGYTEDEVKAIAAATQVPGIDPNTGEATFRPGTPTDSIPSPYPNAIAAAAANNNAIPPDLSLITKARHDGSNYVYSLLTGYSRVPSELKSEYPDFETPNGLHFNEYFANLNIAMAPPLTQDGQVSYGPGNPKPTIRQMSADVAAFLTWTAEPRMDKRKQTGLFVVLFLLFATVLAWFAKKAVWADAKPRRREADA